MIGASSSACSPRPKSFRLGNLCWRIYSYHCKELIFCFFKKQSSDSPSHKQVLSRLYQSCSLYRILRLRSQSTSTPIFLHNASPFSEVLCWKVRRIQICKEIEQGLYGFNYWTPTGFTGLRLLRQGWETSVSLRVFNRNQSKVPEFPLPLFDLKLVGILLQLVFLVFFFVLSNNILYCSKWGYIHVKTLAGAKENMKGVVGGHLSWIPLKNLDGHPFVPKKVMTASTMYFDIIMVEMGLPTPLSERERIKRVCKGKKTNSLVFRLMVKTNSGHYSQKSHRVPKRDHFLIINKLIGCAPGYIGILSLVPPLPAFMWLPFSSISQLRGWGWQPLFRRYCNCDTICKRSPKVWRFYAIYLEISYTEHMPS